MITEGQEIGQLTVIESKSKTIRGILHSLVKCRCGEIYLSARSNLLRFLRDPSQKPICCRQCWLEQSKSKRRQWNRPERKENI